MESVCWFQFDCDNELSELHVKFCMAINTQTHTCKLYGTHCYTLTITNIKSEETVLASFIVLS
jgi:hypothetical protein